MGLMVKLPEKIRDEFRDAGVELIEDAVYAELLDKLVYGKRILLTVDVVHCSVANEDGLYYWVICDMRDKNRFEYKHAKTFSGSYPAALADGALECLRMVKN